MKLLYITNVPVPDDYALDAHFQELDLLISSFNGKLITAFPFDKPSSLIPRSLYGIHNRREIINSAKEADIVHIFSPVYYKYKYIKRIRRKPIVFSSLTPIQHFELIRSVNQYIVYDEESEQRLRHKKVNVGCSPPFTNFRRRALSPPKGAFTLMMASAPWVKGQFATKGVRMLISILNRIPELNLIFIWRGLHYDEMRQLISQSGHQDRIQLINETVDIASWLQQAHAVVLLAQYASIVKSYPNSLMEGLLAGRPVITTSSIAISDEVVANNYGVVLTKFSENELIDKILELKNNYSYYSQAVKSLPASRFNPQEFVAFHERIYNSLLN